MIISDLNYLEAVEGSDVAGGRGKGKKVEFKKRIDVKIDYDANIDVKVKPEIKGNTATGYGEANAKGRHTFTDIELLLSADKYSSSSTVSGVAISA
ncbi:hypothetical protein H6G41_01560 [Tolypothrix sp. FACHB-123]|uniref:hypothetical protein n=1 Tax=Tolypothrix sp. FACHB-123 TaxID=2692868 RepID=UPI001689CF7D|nr:hypothetical protein [Tolypothrix sp. FACHB-123]MBD2353318.1 hypothetical protein [Tolypothrix sp. FACHB-123]